MSHDADAILKKLRSLADPERARGSRRYFKTGVGEYGEGDEFLGIRVPVLRSLVRDYATISPDDTRALLVSRFHEARLLGLLILVRQFQKGDHAARRAIFDFYMDHIAAVNNWDLVDLSAPHIVGGWLGAGEHKLLTKLSKSESVWERRIAILATLSFIRTGYFAETLRLAKLLLHDPHDLIHKAVGWMLREVGGKDRAVEVAFLDKHAAIMPRTMLRYAIEKFPPPMRQRYLKLPRKIS